MTAMQHYRCGDWLTAKYEELVLEHTLETLPDTCWHVA